MRVIGGTAKGRPLRAPRTSVVRPTADRVREAIFDVLGSLGAVEGARVCDLFAGSGALGIEALSRGAEAVTFVETDPVALAALKANLVATGFAGRPGARVVRREARAFLAGSTGRFDVVLADPPYAYRGWDDLLAHVRTRVLVAEHRDPLVLPAHLEEHRKYRYGDTIVTVARARQEAPATARREVDGRGGPDVGEPGGPEDGT